MSSTGDTADSPEEFPLKAWVMGLFWLFPSSLKERLKIVTDFLMVSGLLKYLTIRMATKILASISQITKKYENLKYPV